MKNFIQNLLTFAVDTPADWSFMCNWDLFLSNCLFLLGMLMKEMEFLPIESWGRVSSQKEYELFNLKESSSERSDCMIMNTGCAGI